MLPSLIELFAQQKSVRKDWKMVRRGKGDENEPCLLPNCLRSRGAFLDEHLRQWLDVELAGVGQKAAPESTKTWGGTV